MSRFFFSLSILALIAAGCDGGDIPSSIASYWADDQYKPFVSIVPVIDNTKNGYDWSLSEEFSQAICQRLSQHKQLALSDEGKVHEKTKKFAEKNNPFSPDIAWIKNAFRSEEFVVFLELVEHEEVFNQDRKKESDLRNCSANLNMTMRLRAFDLRGEEPKVILQELVHDTHFIHPQFTSENFYQAPWGTENYSLSPVGTAHAKFVKELAARIEDYILMNSRK